ncbi:hypothetical protein [Hyphomonas sp.]|uniref:hypothetical protein n=1 Tax=Hyphomonas sp. TaxID=87 RepID=UPI000C89F9AA|nr:hypothetical protein [Hyphomonas sp.]MAL45954.1 hypothetical protein [Hyphomonas sp.]
MKTYDNLFEVFAKRGFAYEAMIQKQLYKMGLANTDKTAGASNRADVLFVHKGKEHNLEIGTAGKDFAQGKVHWQKDKWYADTKNSKAITNYLQTLTYDDDLMNQWGPVALGKKTNAQVTSDMRVAAARKGGDLYLTDIDPDIIANYYADKGVYYIHVEGAGAFHLAKNPARLPLPYFDVRPEIRFRVKGYGGGKYDTTWAIKIPKSSLPQSPYTFDPSDTKRKGPAEFLKK